MIQRCGQWLRLVLTALSDLLLGLSSPPGKLPHQFWESDSREIHVSSTLLTCTRYLASPWSLYPEVWGVLLLSNEAFLPPPPVVGAPLQVHPWHFAYRLFLFLTLLILCSSFLPTCDSGETKLFIFTLWPIKTTSTVDLLVERIIIFWGRFFF